METKIYKKILNVQSKIGAIAKSKTNPHFKNSYFDINDIIENLLPLLAEEKLLVTQPLTHLDGSAAIETRVTDSETGEFICSVTPLPASSKAQDMGSAITYFRRYSLQSFFLLQAEDDDGNAASASAVGRVKQPVGAEAKILATSTVEQLEGYKVKVWENNQFSPATKSKLIALINERMTALKQPEVVPNATGKKNEMTEKHFEPNDEGPDEE